MKQMDLSLRKCLLAIAAIVSFLAPSALAEEKQYDLYSWPKGSDTTFCYALQAASTGTVNGVDLKASKNVVCGREQLKNQIMDLPLHSVIVWKQDQAQELTLPRPDVVKGVVRFALQTDRKVVIQENSAQEPHKN